MADLAQDATTSGDETRQAASPRTTSLIPSRAHPNGPVTRTRLRRMFAGLACAWGAGALLARRGRSPRAKALGLGMLLPGGGYVYTKDPARAAASGAAFAGSLGLWWGLGPVLAAPFTWLGSALLASRRAGKGSNWKGAEIAVPAALGAIGAAGLITQQRAFRASAKRGEELNARLSQVTFPISSRPAAPAVVESSPEDLEWLRFAFDLGLQPIDKWDGFNFIDQFRESAVRYQLNYLQYALAVSQYTRTPAFTGYLAEAQRNSIEKMLDLRVWRYWAFENLWGYLKWDPDPIKNDNIMYSAYYGVMLGLYETVTGDHRYDEPGSLTLKWSDRRQYEYDFGSLTDVVRRQMLDSSYGNYPCEPNWIYPYCNTYGMNTAMLYDRLHGAEQQDDLLERFRRGLEEEFVQPDGCFAAVRSSLLGAKVPGTVTGNDALMAYWLHPALPDIAQRTWWLVRDRLIARSNGGSGLTVAPRSWDMLDPGNYKVGSTVFSNVMVALAAREMGDGATADAVEHAIADAPVVTGGGARRFEEASVYTSLGYVLARMQRENALRELIAFGFPEAWQNGPVLSEAAYPDVLVARAVSDGQALDLVLRPGDGAVRTALAIERLTPEATYDVDGATVDHVTAGKDGRAIVEVELDDRREVRVRPRG